MSAKLCLVMTTVETERDAERLARCLVENRLAACVSIVAPMTSIYPWQGRIERAEERALWIKTLPERLDALKEALKEAHPYEVPEMLVLPINDGLDAYFAWARDWMTDED